jgi:transposase-like protein
MAATARKSVHIQGPESTQGRQPRTRKNPGLSGARSQKSRSASPDREGIQPRRPLHSRVPTPSPPAPQEAVAKQKFAAKFAGINHEHFSNLTKQILARAYPRECPECMVPMTAAVARRESVVRCPECHRQASRTAGTPLHHFKLPLWVFGYLLSEAMTTFPQMISAAQIRRRLGVSKSTSLLLKRRLQLFLTDLVPVIKERMANELREEFCGLVLPAKGDVSEIVANKPVVHMDTLALFSATQRANGGRSRHRHSGQTASIYLTEKVAEERGKFQIGTLVHTIALKQGPVILDSVPGLTQKQIQPLFSFIPKQTPTFTDDGYPWLSRYNRNHRAVNHSARAKDKKRNVWARNRWSRGGVHNQVAEGTQRMVKASFLAAYGYFNPKYSQLYLNEYSALKSIRVYGLESLLKTPIVLNVDPK